MKFVITDEKTLSSSVAAFQRRIASFAQSERSLEWAFPSGDKATCLTYSVITDLGELLVAVPEKWEGRQAHLFALNHAGGTLAPHVEINIPDGLDRRVSGAYVQSGESVLICHRGGFTAYRGKIPREVSLTHFEKWMVAVEDDDHEANLISVASLESNSLANDIAEFVSAVTAMKTQFKFGEPVPTLAAQNSKWHDGVEFEGKKSSGKSAPPENYEYLHGPLCNALRRQLKKLVESAPTFDVLSNKNVDVAMVAKSSGIATAIFEVKTSASLSGQLYTAHGQLAYYKRQYGDATTALFLVLPAETRAQMNSLDFFRDSGIEVIYGDKEAFTATNGKALLDVVARCLQP